MGPSLWHVSLLLKSLAYLAGGAPRAASSPSRSGQTLWRALATQEARHDAVLTEMETVLKEPPGPPEPPEAQGPGGS